MPSLKRLWMPIVIFKTSVNAHFDLKNPVRKPMVARTGIRSWCQAVWSLIILHKRSLKHTLFYILNNLNARYFISQTIQTHVILYLKQLKRALFYISNNSNARYSIFQRDVQEPDTEGCDRKSHANTRAFPHTHIACTLSGNCVEECKKMALKHANIL